jgi:hypothetical protein
MHSPSRLSGVTARIEEHVGDRVAHLARRAQDAHVGAIGQHPTRAPEDPVRRACEARGDGFQPTREIARAGGLDDQVRVVALDAVVHEAEAAALARVAPGALELGDEAPAAQRRQVPSHLQCDVAGMARSQRGSPPMRIPRPRSRLASGARPCAAPAHGGAQVEHELPPRSSRHARDRHTSM